MPEDSKEGKNEEGKPNEIKTEIQKQIIRIERDTTEKELEQKIAELEKEKEKLAGDFQTAQDRVKELEKTEQTKTKEYDDLVVERDKLKTDLDDKTAQLTDIALEEFEKEKTTFLKKLEEEKALPEEKLEELKTAWESPEDLARSIDLYNKYIVPAFKAGEEQQKATAAAATEEGKKEEDRKGTDPANPPLGSQVPLKEPDKGKEYQDAREMINDIYERAAKGDKEAVNQKKRLWDRAIQQMKKDWLKGKGGVAFIECPDCGTGIVKGQKCPNCGWDPIASGMKVW